MSDLRIALTKGRLQEDTIGLLTKMGYDCAPLISPGRSLIITLLPNLQIVLAKAPDVITYVEHGVCDMGIVGKDTIMEQGRSFYEVLDLGFGRCRFALATKKDAPFYDSYQDKRIATKYPQVTKDYFSGKNMDVQIIKIEGSVELAPLLGLADAIVDLVETGNTLRANGLAPIEDIAQISARLIVNVASMKMKKAEILPFINHCEQALTGMGEK